MRLKFVSVFPVVLLLALCTSVFGEDTIDEMEIRLNNPEAKIAALRKTVDVINNDDRYGKYHAACPADSFGNEKSTLISVLNWVFSSDEWDEEVCAIASQTCHEACVAGEGGACFALGQTLEDVEAEVGTEADNRAFSLACAAGNADGCTNRGASLRNTRPDDDPWDDRPQEEIDSCTYKLFAIACANDSAWGCTMEGQAHARGEGTVVDLAKAKVTFQKSCAHENADPDDGFCGFALELAEEFGIERKSITAR